MLTPIPLERLPSFWGALLADLAPSFRWDHQRTIADVGRQLTTGELLAFRITGVAQGHALITSGPMVDHEGTGFWIVHIGGAGRSISAMRSVLAEFVAMAEILGCDRVLIEGRLPGWSRIAGADWSLGNDVLWKDI